jgi:hypothetical protein
MSEESIECSLCLESLDKCTVVHLNCCSRQRIHVECYAKSLPKCPFCRAQQPEILPPIHVITDWPRVTRRIGGSFLVSACLTIFILMNAQCAN